VVRTKWLEQTEVIRTSWTLVESQSVAIKIKALRQGEFKHPRGNLGIIFNEVIKKEEQPGNELKR
jgi:hypothetical protein